jgi:hypothetical protein
MSQNELAMQFFGAGFFNPQMADQALACLEMMDFDRKHFVMQRISQNGTMYQQILMMQQQMLQMAQLIDPAMAEQMAAGIMGGAAPGPAPTPVAAGEASGNVESTEALGGSVDKEPAHTKKARQRVADSTSPT